MGFFEILGLLQDVMFFLGYFLPNGKFQEKLSKEDEERYIYQFKVEGNDEAREELINHNLRLVAHIVKKYTTCSIAQEDLLSIGTIGLIKGINTYQIEKGTKFSSYIAKCVDNEILMAIRSESKLSANISLEEAIGTDSEGNKYSLIDVLESNDVDIAYMLDLEVEIKKMNSFIENVLSDREKLILQMRYGLGNHRKYTQNEIAEMLNISRSYVSRIQKKAIEKLSFEFANYKA